MPSKRIAKLNVRHSLNLHLLFAARWKILEKGDKALGLRILL